MHLIWLYGVRAQVYKNNFKLREQTITMAKSPNGPFIVFIRCSFFSFHFAYILMLIQITNNLIRIGNGRRGMRAENHK